MDTTKITDYLIDRNYERTPIADLADAMGLPINDMSFSQALQAMADEGQVEVARAEPWEFGGRGRALPACRLRSGRVDISAQVVRVCRTKPINPDQWETAYFPSLKAIRRKDVAR